jgi:hypothetical protein
MTFNFLVPMGRDFHRVVGIVVDEPAAAFGASSRI